MTSDNLQRLQNLLLVRARRDHDDDEDAECLLENETSERKSVSMIKKGRFPVHNLKGLFCSRRKKWLCTKDMQVPQEVTVVMQPQPQPTSLFQNSAIPDDFFTENVHVSNHFSAFRYPSQIGIDPYDQCNAAQFRTHHHLGTSPPDGRYSSSQSNYIPLDLHRSVDNYKSEFVTASNNYALNRVDSPNSVTQIAQVTKQGSSPLIHCSGLSQQQSGQIPSEDVTVLSKSQSRDYNCCDETVDNSISSEATIGSETNITQNFGTTSSPVHQNNRKKHNQQYHYLKTPTCRRKRLSTRVEGQNQYVFSASETNRPLGGRYKHRAKDQTKKTQKEIPVLIQHLEKIGISTTQKYMVAPSNNYDRYKNKFLHPIRNENKPFSTTIESNHTFQNELLF